MSQLNQPSSSLGIPDQFLGIDIWKALVQVVLEITIQAFQSMRKDHIAQSGWEEDIFTLNLVDYIQPIAHRHPMNLNVKPQVLVFTSDMKKGEVSHKKAVKIDIQLWGGRWENYDQVYFAWECKLIVDKPAQNKHKRLIPEYATEGIFRFLDGRYSSEVEDAGMLGYVLTGDASNIVNAINKRMLKLSKYSLSKYGSHNTQTSPQTYKLSEYDFLKPHDPISGFTDIYQSHHNRISSRGAIRLYHLFLKFDFN